MDRFGDDGPTLLDEVGLSLYLLRRRTIQTPTQTTTARKDLTRDLIVDVVDRAAETATIETVARQLLVTPSIARRLVTECLYLGLITRVPCQEDGRRYTLSLTPDGAALRDRMQRQHREAFEHITRDWSSGERLEFARLLYKYATS